MKTVQELAKDHLAPPQTISGILHGSWPIRILKTATETGVFETMAGGPKTAKEVAETLAMPLTGVGLLLDALVGLKLLERADLHGGGENFRSGNTGSVTATGPIAASLATQPVTGDASPTGPVSKGGPATAPASSGGRKAALFALSDEARLYLLKESALFMGMYLRQSDELDKMWRSLSATVSSGRPVMAVDKEACAGEIFPQLAESIVPLNFSIACDVVRYLKTKRDYFCEPLVVLDVACGGAPWSIPFALESTYTKIDALDFPPVLAVTKKMAEQAGVGKQYRYLEGNWSDVQLFPGKYDVAILGHILHSEGRERSKQLIGRCYDTLQPGGALVIAEFMTNREHTGPVYPLMFGLNMYLATTDGCVFSLEELKQLCAEAGFAEVIRHSGIGYDSPVLLAFK